MRQFAIMGLLLVFVSLLIMSCSSTWLTPAEMSAEERWKALPHGPAPIKAPLTIHWNIFAIPYIEAEDDADAAFGLGLIQAHLRLGQLEILRIVSNGRMSEIVGPLPFAQSLDHAVRLLDFRGAAMNSLKVIPKESKQWIERFAEGINWYQRHLKVLPYEHRMFGIEATDFTPEDIMTIGRLASADLTWGIYARFLKLAGSNQDRIALEFMLKKQEFDVASFENVQDLKLIQLIRDLTRSGSNSVAVGGGRTFTGAAMLANDPHVGLFLPNFWILAGLKSPNYHNVGLMIPGLPFFGLGRNPDIAWGGTNMRAISSHLYDVSALPETQKQIRFEVLKRRFWFDKTIAIRETPYGPILSDLDFFENDKIPFEIALQWLGREPSDEIGSFLLAQRAHNWEEFVAAFDGYRVSAMNLLYADRMGHIGMLPAYGQPVLRETDRTLDLIKKPENPRVGVLSPRDLPRVFDPLSGIIASANNKPFAHPAIPLAFAFANNDRHDRMLALLGPLEKIRREDLFAIQQDVYSQSAFDLKQSLMDRLKSPPEAPIMQAFKLWDGNYRLESKGAVAFEILMYYAYQDYMKEQPKDLRAFLVSYDGWKALLKPWLNAMPQEGLQEAVGSWVNTGNEGFTKIENWGQFHRQTMQHPFGAIPLLGRAFRRSEFGENGGNDTLNKSGRPFTPESASVTYGASARHVSDLSDPDANYFVLKGGQDGWLNNPHLDDQIGLWRSGQYIQMPLSMELVEAQFQAAKTRLVPGHRD